MARYLTLLFLSMFCCGPVVAQGSVISDPTRPPAAFISGAVAQSEAAVDQGNRLRSVILPKSGGRPSAVIDGKFVRLGGLVGDSRLTRITETSVVLTGQNGKETLYLTPDVSKKMVSSKTVRQRQKENP